jgi:hypothetical protein
MTAFNRIVTDILQKEKVVNIRTTLLLLKNKHKVTMTRLSLENRCKNLKLDFE